MANSPATLTLKTKLIPGLFTPPFPSDLMHLCGVLWNYKFFGALSKLPLILELSSYSVKIKIWSIWADCTLKSKMNYSIHYRSMMFTLSGVIFIQLRPLPLICGETSDICLHWVCCFSGRAISHLLMQEPPWSRLHSLNHSVMCEDSSCRGTQFFSLICSDSSLFKGKQWKVGTQIQSQHKDLKDLINLINTFQRVISENEMYYCKNFLPVNALQVQNPYSWGQGLGVGKEECPE